MFEIKDVDMKDMGLADVILGIKIIRTQNGLVLSQAHYVDKILNTHNAGDSGQARTPIDTSLHLSKNRGLGVAQLEYSRIIGMLMYLMGKFPTLISIAVSRLSRHPAVIEGYSDANWISNIKDSRSTSGYVFTLGGASISWKSSKQTVIAKSTMESEFIALDKCGEEAEWLRQFMKSLCEREVGSLSKELWGAFLRALLQNEASYHMTMTGQTTTYEDLDNGTEGESCVRLSRRLLLQLWTLSPWESDGELFYTENRVTITEPRSFTALIIC
ncbi:hypothetical protein Tco_0725840 [Tanacetum coccineum]|uniref:Reverse transcriptase Ty1/copia-type domain-containing protein n=1 Tax=Tanacetum coccineum TaxID=301880 RepID=A0ABQ4YE07_9ASTR